MEDLAFFACHEHKASSRASPQGEVELPGPYHPNASSPYWLGVSGPSSSDKPSQEAKATPVTSSSDFPRENSFLEPVLTSPFAKASCKVPPQRAPTWISRQFGHEQAHLLLLMLDHPSFNGFAPTPPSWSPPGSPQPTGVSCPLYKRSGIGEKALEGSKPKILKGFYWQ